MKSKGVREIPMDTKEQETTALMMRRLELNLSSMYYRYKQFVTSKKKEKGPTLRHHHYLYLQWMEQRMIYEDVEKFSGEAHLLFKNRDPLETANVYQFFNSINPYHELDLRWEFRFDAPLMRRLKSGNTEFRKKILSVILRIAKGNFTSARLHKMGPLNFMASFYCNIEQGSFLAFCVLPERVPVVQRGTVTSYKYEQYLRFLDIVPTVSRIERVLDSLFGKIVNHPDKFKCFEYGEYVDQLPFAEVLSLKDLGVSSLTNVISIVKPGSNFPSAINSFLIESSQTLHLPKLKDVRVYVPKSDSKNIYYDHSKKYWQNTAKIEYAPGKANYIEKAIAVSFK